MMEQQKIEDQQQMEQQRQMEEQHQMEEQRQMEDQQQLEEQWQMEDQQQMEEQQPVAGPSGLQPAVIHNSRSAYRTDFHHFNDSLSEEEAMKRAMAISLQSSISNRGNNVSPMTEEEQVWKDSHKSTKTASEPSYYRPDHIRPGPRATIFHPPAHIPTSQQEEEEEADQGASGEGKQHHSY